MERYKDFSDEKRKALIKKVLNLLYMHENPWFWEKLIYRTPYYEEDASGEKFETYLRSLQEYKYLIDEERLDPHERCWLAKKLLNTEEFSDLYDKYLISVVEDTCTEE